MSSPNTRIAISRASRPPAAPSPTRRPAPLPLDATVDLVERVRTGDQDAWAALINRFLGPLKQLGHNRLRGHARGMTDTDDVVQDALINTVKRLDRVDCRNRGALSAYLRRAVLNRIVDAARRSSRMTSDDDAIAEARDLGPSPLDHLLDQEEARRYRAALATLSPRDRTLIVLRLRHQLPYRDLADRLGLSSPDAARMASMRAFCRLAEALKRL
ncbi:MAG: sigma-70 family RNA polymerase sigma factor [Vicinamibacterales bacterium]